MITTNQPEKKVIKMKSQIIIPKQMGNALKFPHLIENQNTILETMVEKVSFYWIIYYIGFSIPKCQY